MPACPRRPRPDKNSSNASGARSACSFGRSLRAQRGMRAFRPETVADAFAETAGASPAADPATQACDTFPVTRRLIPLLSG